MEIKRDIHLNRIIARKGNGMIKVVTGMRHIMERFQQRNGATQCKLLKGAGTGRVLRECPLCVADASEFLEELLDGNVM